ncbi:MAG: S41 family peptidase [Niabella sp.]
MKKILIWLPVLLVVLTACPRSKKDTVTGPTLMEKIIDTSYQYSKEIYLWYGQLPTSVNVKDYDDPNALMEYIRNYSFEPDFNRDVDRWSFAMKQSEWDDVSQGIAGDFGLGVFFMAANDLRVKSVEKLSPAGVAGIKRGWRITKINDHTSITTSDADISYIVNAIFYSTSAKITFTKPDGSSQEYTVTAKTYQEQPVFLDTIYNEPAGKVGYMVYNSFLGDSAYSVDNFSRVFNKFATTGINELIVDLRYNSGGYVWIQQLLGNYIVNSSGNGNISMIEQFNALYSRQFNDTAYFSKKGSVNLNKVYFIVTAATASASELLINALKPFMNVQLVGSKTEGKAVGFFPISVGEWYIFPVSFRTVNAQNIGNYFDGLSPVGNALGVSDGLDKDWGDKQENMLKVTLAAINNGGVFAYSPNNTTISRSVYFNNQNKKLKNPDKFSGAIETRRLTKK